MSAFAVLEAPGKQSAQVGPAMVFVLDQKGKHTSGYTRKDTVGSRNPVKMDVPLTYMLPLRSRHYLGEGQGYIPTQYVIGADTIFVNDYKDEKGEIRKGLRSQGYDLDKEYERAMQTPVTFKTGILDLRKLGANKNLIEYVNLHEGNSDSPAGKNPARNVNKMFSFSPMKAEIKAAKATASFEDKLEGMKIVGALRSQGNGGYVYDKARVDAIIGLLNATRKFEPNDYNQKFEHIMRVAEANPVAFKDLVQQSISEVEMTLGKAVTLGYLEISSKSATLKLPKTQGRVIMEFADTIKEDERLLHLSLKFLGDIHAIEDLRKIEAEIASSMN